MKKLLCLLLTLTLSLATLTAFGCGSKNENEIKIGILQVATHSALDDARQGFKDTVDAWAKANGKTVKYDEKNANGDASNELILAESLITAKCDLVLGIATSSARALANASEKTPTLFTAVTDPEGEQLIRSNVTGTSDLNPVADQIALIKEIVGDGCDKVAFLYNSSENNSVLQFSLAQAKCSELGIELVGKTATAASDIQTVVESIDQSFDAVYIPTDNLMASNGSLICSILSAKGIPTVVGESGMCEDGEAVATLGIDYYKLGVQTAEMAIKVLSGEKAISEISFEFYNQPSTFFINETNALACGLTQAKIDALKANHA